MIRTFVHTIDGTRIECLLPRSLTFDVGVCVIPGMLSTAEWMHSNMATLGAAVFFSFRGRGLSYPSTTDYTFTRYVEDAESVVQLLRSQRTVIIAYSVGASVACELANRYPGRFSQLILIDPIIPFPSYSREWAEKNGMLLGFQRKLMEMIADDSRLGEKFIAYPVVSEVTVFVPEMECLMLKSGSNAFFGGSTASLRTIPNCNHSTILTKINWLELLTSGCKASVPELTR